MSQSRFISKIYADVRKFDNNMQSWTDINSNSTVGDIKFSILSSDHLGYLLCDGRSVLATDYSDLFDVIGTSFGSASSGHFNLPNCQGRVLGAAGHGSGLTSRSIGDTVGEETHAMTLNEMVSHNHTGTVDAAGTHTHTTNSSAGPGGLGLIRQSVSGESDTGVTFDSGNSGSELDLISSSHTLVINSVGNHVHSFTSNNTGNSAAFNVIQPTLFIGNVFIYAKNVFMNA